MHKDRDRLRSSGGSGEQMDGKTLSSQARQAQTKTTAIPGVMLNNVSETSKRHLKRQQPQSDAKSDAKFAASVQFLTCHFTVVAFRGRCTILQKSSFHGC